MFEHPDLGLRAPSVAASASDGVDGYATAADVPYAAELAGLDRTDREAGCYDADLDVPPPWDEAVRL